MFTTARSRVKLLATVPVVLVIVWTVFNLHELLRYHGNILTVDVPIIVGLSILFESYLVVAVAGYAILMYIWCKLASREAACFSGRVFHIYTLFRRSSATDRTAPDCRALPLLRCQLC